jgi:hypothetical protein
VKKELKRRKKEKIDTPYLFPNKSGTGKITDFRKAWNKACEQQESGRRSIFKISEGRP